MNVARCVLLLVVLGNSLTASAAGPTLHPQAVALPFAHQGPFVTTGDDGILCIDAKHAFHSRDEGKTWTATRLFPDTEAFQISNERTLLRTRDGVVIAAWMNLQEKTSAPGFKWGGSAEEFAMWVLPIYVCRSLDDGKTWEPPVLLNRPWCGCIHSMIELASGRIVLVGQEVIPEWRHATVMFVSDDKGRTWRRSKVLDIGQGRHDHAGSIEGTVVERRDGTLYELLRTETGWLYESTSADGLQWTDLKQSPLKSVTCCAQMTRLSDGSIAVLWNAPPRDRPDNRSSREELSIAFSNDECRSWSQPIVVAANFGTAGRVSYPYLYERLPGELWITTMQGGLRMKIKVADLGKGAIPPHHSTASVPNAPGGIVMFGDSTTAQRPGAIEHVYADRVQDMLVRIGSSLQVYNAGVGSNTTVLARQRFAKDVLAHRPRIVVIQFGLNDASVDVWKTPPATMPRVPLADYEANLRSMIDAARKSNVQPILMTTNPLRWSPKTKELYGRSPYVPDKVDGFDKPVLAGYNARVCAIADELKVPLIDVHAAFSEKKPEDLLLDGMHPNDQGHTIIAELLLPVIREQIRNP
ncbi:MAG: exo-alpha-sialidase [Planctomycetes bacterium]|nr:exo-alpha-sialidase [Planctomycetota bacterium]